MSAFSRGCRRTLNPQPQLVFHISRTTARRKLNSSSILHYARPKPKPRLSKHIEPLPTSAKPTPTPSRTSSPPTALPSASPAHAQAYKSYGAELASKASPTLLYRAPPQAGFYIASYTSAAFCFTYAAYNLNTNYLYPPPDLSPWVPYAFGGVCFMMAGFGGWLILGPARLVRSITAVPTALSTSQVGMSRTASTSRALASPSPSSSPSRGRAAAQDGVLELRIELRKMFPVPLLPRRVLTVAPEEVRVEMPLSVPLMAGLGRGRGSASGGDSRQQGEMGTMIDWRHARRLQEIEQTRFWRSPMAWMSLALQGAFWNVARTWRREGFLRLQAKGGIYKLDIIGCRTLDSGKAFDRLVKVGHF